MNNTYLKLLEIMLEDMQNQPDYYKPTAFWQECSKLIVNELQLKGFEHFRSFASSNSFFVPQYSFPNYFNNLLSHQEIKNNFLKLSSDIKSAIKLKRLLSGELFAFSDYRVLKASNICSAPHLDKLSESTIGSPLEHFSFDGKLFSRSFLNYLLGLSFLKKHINTRNIHNVLEIGGGYGTLGEILLSDEQNNCFYINIDIPPVASVSTYYLQSLFGKENIADYLDLKNENIIDIDTLKKQYRAINTCSWQIEKLQGKIDLFVNFISFQEMEPEVVNNYCLYVEKLQPSYILLRNIEEGKKQKCENTLYGVNNPILGNDYDTFLPQYKLIAKDSTIFGYTTEDGFHSQLRLYQRQN